MTPRRRCAIYTRKSTEEGLERDFNSLHAQREACEAFIVSQKHEGWSCLRESYDDGGFSGGSTDRPALQRLLADISEGKIDVVVVYKVDRLTRSLADFAKIVEIFDAEGVSFVSVTQQFNTTTSMGRLTLNVLLSFAQFEREVTGERIRDKIAASKKKGLWMGGLVPLGYDLKDRNLLINPAEAETVRTLFRIYLELGTVRRLKEEADHRSFVTKRRQLSSGRAIGGGPFTRGHLYCLLSNPIYAGDVRHRGVTYSGRHEAIIDRETFGSVQRQLTGNAAERGSRTNAKVPSLLTGLVYDETGDRLCPTHANKKGRRYRYYISKRLMHGTGTDGWRLPAKELERVVLDALRDFLCDQLRLVRALRLDNAIPRQLGSISGRAQAVARELYNDSSEHPHLRTLLHRIIVAADSILLEIRKSGLTTLLGAPQDGTASGDELFRLVVPIRVKRRGVEAKLVMSAVGGRPPAADSNLIRTIAEAHRWLDDLAEGRATSLRDLARHNRRDVGEVSRSLPLAFLAPDVVEAILQGSQPVGLVSRRLKRIAALPARWHDQRRHFASWR
jgi:DNA invertase Pin-like site-specific DNA recombinase